MCGIPIMLSIQVYDVILKEIFINGGFHDQFFEIAELLFVGIPEFQNCGFLGSVE